jgi:hypothetical protein
MSFTMRVATAIVLAAALAGLPTLLDHCASSCDAHHPAASTTPSCHHAGAAQPRIGGVPAICGHDHNGVAAVASPRGAAGIGSPITDAVFVSHPLAVAPAAANLTSRRLPMDSPPRSVPPAHVGTLPLRI